MDVAVAVTGTVSETAPPFVGEVREAETPVLVTASVTGIVCGEAEALGSEIVVVAV